MLKPLNLWAWLSEMRSLILLLSGFQERIFIALLQGERLSERKKKWRGVKSKDYYTKAFGKKIFMSTSTHHTLSGKILLVLKLG